MLENHIVQPEILQDSTYGTHKYITANGIKFHYVANGTEGKPLMLFLHGYPEVSCHYNLLVIYISLFSFGSHGDSNYQNLVEITMQWPLT